jgi:chromosome segregation ATPase
MQGIGNGIREILIKVDKLGTGHKELTDAIGRVEYQQNEQGFDIRGIKRDQTEMKQTLEEHGDRLVDLERRPTPVSMPMVVAQASIPPIASLGRASKSGSFPADVVHEAWGEVEKSVAAMNGQLADLTAKMAVLEEEKKEAERQRELEKARAKGAEEERDLQAQKNLDDIKAWDRRLRWAKIAGGGFSAIMAAIAALSHFLHW